uniref:AlNc14C25G2509 protein n=1 Tax=Albugo laibachii Nc14 TaxID=890382 RepID=F0W6M1_9STRA|nr:AlNc14C25G2509 [Albugo laibachii Nc14]|eukprot:CCA16766.1 AlNc14C25G2509 [Albugo laibachii Nc14]
MCDYESGRLENNLDLNLLQDGNELSALASDVKDSRPFKVANVMVVKWGTKGSKNLQEVAAFEDCFICLTRKRKVVLISSNKRYVWMVDSGSFPNCETCTDKVTFGPQFPYSQYIGQRSVEDAKKWIGGFKQRKRSRTDE